VTPTWTVRSLGFQSNFSRVTVLEAGWSTPNGRPDPLQDPRFLADELAVALATKAPGDLVFTASEGGVLRNSNIRPRFFDPAAEKTGLPGFTPHGLCHTAASLAVAAGANVNAVQQMLGHASAAMTLDVYAGLFADDLDRVADQLDRAFTRLNADNTRACCLRTPDLRITRECRRAGE
jgi:hypothetical protein